MGPLLLGVCEQGRKPPVLLPDSSSEEGKACSQAPLLPWLPEAEGGIAGRRQEPLGGQRGHSFSSSRWSSPQLGPSISSLRRCWGPAGRTPAAAMLVGWVPKGTGQLLRTHLAEGSE